MASIWSHDPLLRARQARGKKGFLYLPSRDFRRTRRPPSTYPPIRFTISRRPTTVSRPKLTRFLQQSSADWIIYDFAPYWLPPIAAKLGISRAFFNAVNAWFLAFLGPSTALIDGSDPRTKLEDYTVTPNWVPFPCNLAHRYYEIKWIAENVQNITADVLDTYRLGSAIIGCDILATRDCHEYEPNWLRLLQDLNKRPVVPVGLMPPSVQDSMEETNDTWLSIRGWLHGQNKGSVVYVALGSELAPSQETLTELALGLELSGVPFFWALRNPPGSSESDSVQLPDGFKERTKGCGVVWTSWVPQLKILAHDSVGCFLTHCGWSSIIEGLQFGHPLVMLPFMVEQGLNARIFEKNQVGIEIPRDERDGSLRRNSVAESLSLVMSEDKGRIYQDKAREMKTIFGDKVRHDRKLLLPKLELGMSCRVLHSPYSYSCQDEVWLAGVVVFCPMVAVAEKLDFGDEPSAASEDAFVFASVESPE
ncbi:hypothetical protein Acr_09g0005360 [Actinidia rufa]|uniref:Glycosyltransferase n=1 Tax=Actinidia rufa TaxID=165716 RepID=A0A7J0F5Y7_9ERIC|nr:hypothetical protein Acr_09g0005360 [Actinidia rufa]